MTVAGEVTAVGLTLYLRKRAHFSIYFGFLFPATLASVFTPDIVTSLGCQG